MFIANCSEWFDCDQIINQVKKHPTTDSYKGNRDIPLDDPFYKHH